MHCDHCPVVAGIACAFEQQPPACAAVAAGVARLAYSAVARSEGPAGICRLWPAFAAAAGIPCAPAVASARGPAGGPATPPLPSVAESRAVLEAVAACPVRSPAGCGCGGSALCFRSGSPARVKIDDCRGCRSR